MTQTRFNEQTVALIREVVLQNKQMDFTTADLSDEATIAAVRVHGISLSRDEVIEKLKAYQRIIRLCGDIPNSVCFELLENNITSAMQIAAMSKMKFLNLISETSITTPELAELIYNRAREKRSRLVVHYMNELQNNEPHIKQANF